MTTTDRLGSDPQEPAAVAAPSRRRWTVLAVVVACSVVVFLDKALLGLVAGPMKHDLHLSSAEFGSISGASYLLYGVTCLVVSFLADRISPRWVLLACGLMWTVGQVPAMLAVSGAVVYASRLAVGAAEGPAQPMSHVVAYSWFPNDRRGVPASLITTGASIAKIVFAPVVTLVIVGYGWRAGFASVGLLALVWSVAWLLLGRVGPYSTGADSPGTPTARRLPWHRFLRTGTFLGALLAYFTQGALAAVIFTWLPMYFQHGLGLSQALAGSLIGLPSAMAIVALLAVGWLSDRMLRRGAHSRLARGVFGGCCVGLSGLVLCTLPWIHNVVLAVLAVMLGYGVSTTVQTVSNPVVAEIVPPQQRAGALGLLTALGTSAGVVSPIVAGRLLDTAPTPQAGYTAAFLLFGLLVAFGGLCFAVLVNPERDARRVARTEHP